MLRIHIESNDVPATAASAITGQRFVKTHSSSAVESLKMEPCTTGKPFGIAADDAASGDAVAVVTGGICWLDVDGTTAVAAGDPLGPSTGGVGVKVTASGGAYCARAMDPVASGTRKIRVNLEHGYLP